MSSFFDFVDSIELYKPSSPAEKAVVMESTNNGNESGIESASSSSSLDEPGKISSDKFVITSTTRLKPQQSNLNDVVPSYPLEMAVIFRGRLPMISPVAYDPVQRLNSMKNEYAKKVQHLPTSTFAAMHIDSEYIRLFSMEEPRVLLYEIECDKLDLVKRSQRDLSFFYFSTYTPVKTNVGRVESQGEKDANLSRYVVYVFHGTSPKMAERACKIIKHFIDLKASRSSSMPSIFSPQEKKPIILNSLNSLASPTLVDEQPKEEPKVPTNEPIDLLFNVDDFKGSNSMLEMFDTLVSTSKPAESVAEAKPKEVDLLGDCFTLPPKQDNSFVSRHLNYSTQMPTNLNYASTNYIPAHSTSMCNPSVNPFLTNSMTSTNLAPSFPSNLQPQPTMATPFWNPQMMAPPVPAVPPRSGLPPPMKPQNSNPFLKSPNSANKNGFSTSGSSSGNVSGSHSHQSTAAMNPFNSGQATSQSNRLSTSFGSDFNDFLSQAVKGHLHNNKL